MSADPAHVALIGCGYWGSNFLRIIQNSSLAHLAKVCDADDEKFTEQASENPAISFTRDLDEILNDETITAAVVCTPVNTHYHLTRKLLEAGKHVLCEKPLTCSTEQCLELQTIAKERHLVLLTGHVFEYHSVIEYIKKLIGQKAIGDVLYLQLTRMGLGPVRNDVSVVFDLAAHDVGIAISLIGKMPVAVAANGSCFMNNGLEDVAFITLEFPNKILAGINVSWIDPIKQRLVKVVGTKKMLIFDDVSVSEKLKVIETGKNYQNTSGDFGSFQLSIKDGEIVIPNLPHPEPLVSEFNHFINCIKGQELPRTDTIYSTNVVRILEAIETSMRQNGKKIMLA